MFSRKRFVKNIRSSTVAFEAVAILGIVFTIVGISIEINSRAGLADFRYLLFSGLFCAMILGSCRIIRRLIDK